MVQRLRKAVFTLLKGVITLSVIYLLVRKLGWSSITATILSATPLWLYAALVVFLISAFLGVVQWRILLSNRGIVLPFGRICRLYFIGMFFNNFIMGGIIGDALKVASIKARDGRGKAGFAATVLDRFAGLWAMCGFAVAGSVLLLRRGVYSGGGIETAAIALFAAFLLFAGIMALLMSKTLQGFFFSLLERLPVKGKSHIRAVTMEMLIEARDIHVLLQVASLSALVQLLRIGVHVLAAHSLGLLTFANFHYFFIFVPIIAMLMTLPLPFGVREAAGGTLFSLAGFPTDAAYIMGFLASLIGLAASFLGGLFYILDKTVSKERT